MKHAQRHRTQYESSCYNDATDGGNTIKLSFINLVLSTTGLSTVFFRIWSLKIKMYRTIKSYNIVLSLTCNFIYSYYYLIIIVTVKNVRDSINAILQCILHNLKTEHHFHKFFHVRTRCWRHLGTLLLQHQH